MRSVPACLVTLDLGELLYYKGGGSGVLSVVLRGEGGLVFVYYVVTKNSKDSGGKEMSFAILLRKHCRNRGDEPSREEKVL